MAATAVETSSSVQAESECAVPKEVTYETLVAQGNRNLMCKEIPQAVNQLQEAARLVAEKFGETANECAEVYLNYGTALLELARMENTVLGNAMTGIPAEPAEEEEENAVENTFVEPDETTEEEKEKISDEVLEAMVEADEKDKDLTAEGDNIVKEGEKGDGNCATEDAKESDEARQKVDERGDHKDVGESVESSDVVVEVGEADDDAEEENEGEEAAEDAAEENMDDDDDGRENGDNISQEDVSNLQLAWEMIELSKSIYKRDEVPEAKLKQADCLLRLGDISVESEQYTQAVSDFQECLKLLESTVEPSSRRLAETHYQVALACGYNNAFDEAVSHYRSAIHIIQLKISELQDVINKAKDQDPESNEGKELVGEDPVSSAKKELEELQSLIPDIQIKIDDAEEEKKAQGLKEVIRQSFIPGAKGEEGTSSSFQVESSASLTSPSAADVEKPVQNISHLVRKKRKLEEETNDSDVKKSKNGDLTSQTKCKPNNVVETELMETVPVTNTEVIEDKSVNAAEVDVCLNEEPDH